MAYDGNRPTDNENFNITPGLLRENFRALKDDKIVNAQKLMDYNSGNASGNIPISNGTLCTNLNADKLDGQDGSYYQNASNINAGTIGSSYLPTISVSKGGTNITSYTAGDILYASGSTTLAKLTKGTAGQLLRMNSGAVAPEWYTASFNQPAYVPYSVNSGLTSTNKVSNTEVSFVLASGGCIVTFPSGKTYTLITINNVTGISADGTYDFIIEESNISNGVVTPKAVLSSIVNETTANGTGGNDGDYNLNIQVRPLYPEKKISGTWTHTEFLKIGGLVKTSGTLGTPYVYTFNGKYISADVTINSGNSIITTFQHNIGTNQIQAQLYVRNYIAEQNYSVGDITKPYTYDHADNVFYRIPFAPIINRNSVQFIIDIGIGVQNKVNGVMTGIIVANWKQFVICERSF